MSSSLSFGLEINLKKKKKDGEKGEEWSQLTNFNTTGNVLFALYISEYNKIVSLILTIVYIDIYVILHIFNIFFQLRKDT